MSDREVYLGQPPARRHLETSEGFPRMHREGNMGPQAARDQERPLETETVLWRLSSRESFGEHSLEAVVWKLRLSFGDWPHISTLHPSVHNYVKQCGTS